MYLSYNEFFIGSLCCSILIAGANNHLSCLKILGVSLLINLKIRLRNIVYPAVGATHFSVAEVVTVVVECDCEGGARDVVRMRDGGRSLLASTFNHSLSFK